MREESIREILEKHSMWLKGKDGGVRADLRRANLRRADLCGADLRWADLCEADLCGANLREADLCGANLRMADLCWADLRGADLRYTDLRRADLRETNLFGTNLYGADLYGADLCRAKDIPELMRTFVPPECGSFVAWKKIDNYIIKLQIPEDAKRSSATTRKCRASAAFVLEIQNLDGSESGVSEIVHTAYGHDTVYKVGATTYPDKWDDDRWNECSHGIHFFITRQEAVDY